MAKVSDISLDTSSTWPLLSSKGGDGQRELTNEGSRRSLQGRKSYAVREQSQHAVYSLSSANVMCLKCSALESRGQSCGSPNVCSRCTLSDAPRVSTLTSICQYAQSRILTMIDLPAFLGTSRCALRTRR